MFRFVFLVVVEYFQCFLVVVFFPPVIQFPVFVVRFGFVFFVSVFVFVFDSDFVAVFVLFVFVRETRRIHSWEVKGEGEGMGTR